MGVAAGLAGPSRDLAEPAALSPTVRHSLVEGRNKDAGSGLSNSGLELDSSKLGDHTPVTKKPRINLVIPIDHTKDIYI